MPFRFARAPLWSPDIHPEGACTDPPRVGRACVVKRRVTAVLRALPASRVRRGSFSLCLRRILIRLSRPLIGHWSLLHFPSLPRACGLKILFNSYPARSRARGLRAAPRRHTADAQRCPSVPALPLAPLVALSPPCFSYTTRSSSQRLAGGRREGDPEEDHRDEDAGA